MLVVALGHREEIIQFGVLHHRESEIKVVLKFYFTPIVLIYDHFAWL